jgi:hypothetical protein
VREGSTNKRNIQIFSAARVRVSRTSFFKTIPALSISPNDLLLYAKSILTYCLKLAIAVHETRTGVSDQESLYKNLSLGICFSNGLLHLHLIAQHIFLFQDAQQ